jgi:hypothetical protein
MDIVDVIYSYLPAKRKQTPSGWTKFNAVCCSNNSSSIDTRARGGIIRNGEGCSYHCFNCGFKASYVNGRHLTRKMRQLLSWLGTPDDTVNKLALEALRIQQDTVYLEEISLPKFEDKELPKDSVLLTADNIDEQTIPAIEYVYRRGLTLDDYDFYVSKSMPDRIIVPFKFENRIVGYTARKLSEGKPKYISEQTPGYVFNLDAQSYIPWCDERYVIVVEGPMDALSTSGVAILGADVMDKQAMLINKLGMIPVLVPDRDADGLRTIEQALANKWKVSLPDWHQDIKDSNDAILKYGKLWTLKSIFDGIETNELKVKLRMKKWVSSKE